MFLYGVSISDAYLVPGICQPSTIYSDKIVLPLYRHICLLLKPSYSALQPKSAALKDPQARKEVQRRLEDLARQGLFITQASRDLDAILMERRAAY